MITILAFLIINKSHAQIFEMKNCYYKSNDTSWSEEEWLKYSHGSELLSINSTTGERNYSNKDYKKYTRDYC